jgi:glycosyltransferase involved in cell wall biosynthesis
MPEPILSFCIPTYNFGAFIAETLDSIAGQLAGQINESSRW